MYLQTLDFSFDIKYHIYQNFINSSLHLHNFFYNKHNHNQLKHNSTTTKNLFDRCLPVAFTFFFLTSTFFWTLCAICVAPIKISSSFMGLILSATCKFEKKCLVIKIHHKLKILTYLHVPTMSIQFHLYSLIVCVKFNKSEFPFSILQKNFNCCICQSSWNKFFSHFLYLFFSLIMTCNESNYIL